MHIKCLSGRADISARTMSVSLMRYTTANAEYTTYYQMAEKITLEKIEEAVKKLENLEEKKKYLEKILIEIKNDEELKAEVEKILNKVEEIMQTTDKDTLEKKFTTPIPKPELPEELVKSEIKEVVLASPAPELPEGKPSGLEKYERPGSDLYGVKTSDLEKSSQKAVHDIVEKYLRGERVRPDEFASSYELQKQATIQAYERFGGEINFYTLQEQVRYEAEKAAHPELTWERDAEGWIKYKPIKGIEPKVKEEE